MDTGTTRDGFPSTVRLLMNDAQNGRQSAETRQRERACVDVIESIRPLSERPSLNTRWMMVRPVIRSDDMRDDEMESG